MKVKTVGTDPYRTCHNFIGTIFLFSFQGISQYLTLLVRNESLLNTRLQKILYIDRPIPTNY